MNKYRKGCDPFEEGPLAIKNHTLPKGYISPVKPFDPSQVVSTAEQIAKLTKAGVNATTTLNMNDYSGSACAYSGPWSPAEVENLELEELPKRKAVRKSKKKKSSQPSESISSKVEPEELVTKYSTRSATAYPGPWPPTGVRKADFEKRMKNLK